QLRRDDAPPLVGERELPLPHAGVQRKGVKKHEDAAPAHRRGRRPLEIAQSSQGRHPPIVNVPPARVESLRVAFLNGDPIVLARRGRGPDRTWTASDRPTRRTTR